MPWPNYPAAAKAEIASRLAFDDHWLGLPEPIVRYQP
jgi:hypothetical protein